MADHQVTQADGSVVHYDTAGHAIRQVAPDGQVTTFEYRAGGQYVATTGNQHVLYGSDGVEIKQWTGADESQAAAYHRLANGHYRLTDPNGDVTEFSADGHPIRQVADGQATTFEYRGDDYVATSGDQHVLYNSAGVEVKQWNGADEGNAQFYRDNHDGTYILEDPRAHTTAAYELDDNDPVWQRNADGSVTTFESTDEGLVGATGNDRVLYDAGGHEVKQWRTADDPKVFYTSDHAELSPTYYRDRIEATDDDGFYRDRIEAKDFYTSTGPEDRQFYKSVGPGDEEFYTSTRPGETETRMVRPSSQVNKDGSVTNFEYRDNGEYVGTTGDEHVLYDANDQEIKQWKGDDESKALYYRKNPDGTYTLSDPAGGTSTTYEEGSNHYVSQVNKDKSTTTFSYRSNGDYVATTGNQHVLYNSGGDEIKQWTGDDESKASLYADNGDGTYTLTNSDGTVTTYESSTNHFVKQINKDKTTTTFSYRPNGDYVGTTGNQHVLYNSAGDEIKQWTGDDESKASFYHDNGDGTYALTDPDGTVTTYDSVSNHYIKQVKLDGTVTTFQYRADGTYVGTTGDLHVLYNADGTEIKEWKGDNEASAAFYHKNGDGTYTLTEPNGTVTTYNTQGQAIRIHKPGEEDQVITYNPDGTYVVTQGAHHWKYDKKGMLLQEWEGLDESKAYKYTYNDDGTLTITGPDGTNTYGANGMPISGDFLVDLKALSDAMVSIKTQRNQVESDLVDVKNTFTGMVDDWDSPAGRSFQELTGDFMNASLDLVSTLDEGLRRMHVAYNNYVASESQNAATIAAIDAAGQKLKNGVTP